MAVIPTPPQNVFAHAAGVLVISALGAMTSLGCTTTVIESPPASVDGPTEDPPDAVPDAQSCSEEGIALPVAITDATPASAEGTSCGHESANAEDGTPAIVTWTGPAKGKLDAIDVGGCLLVQFGKGVKLKSLTMKMRPVAGGCGHTCSPGDKGCGTGWGVQIFAGTSPTKLKHVQTLTLTTGDFFEYRIAVSESYAAKYMAICKAPTGPDTDDIALDSVYGFCR